MLQLDQIISREYLFSLFLKSRSYLDEYQIIHRFKNPDKDELSSTQNEQGVWKLSIKSLFKCFVLFLRKIYFKKFKLFSNQF